MMETESTPMTIPEITVRSSIHVIQMDQTQTQFAGFGSGCLIRHRGRDFILTVAHVIDNGFTHLETNLPYVPGEGTPLYSVGAMTYFKALEATPEIIQEIDDIEKFLQGGKRIDIAFAELKEFVQLLQPEQDFGAFKISAGPKAIRSFDEIALPEEEEEYFFYGKVRQDPQGHVLNMTATFKHGFKFHGARRNGEIFLFRAPNFITDVEDYEGCSGAPILDSKGRIVALAAVVVTNTKILYGIPIEKCRYLMDLAIDTGRI